MIDINGSMWHVAFKRFRVRRTGKTKTWKTRPGQYKIPVKFGLYESGYLTHDNSAGWHDGDYTHCQACEQREKEERRP